MNAIDGLLDLVNRILLGRQHSQREIPIVGVGGGVGHMRTERGLLAQRIIAQVSATAGEVIPQFHQPVVLLLPLAIDAEGFSCDS